MLRRITRSSNGRVGPFSGAILPACATLLVPLLAAFALELPAAAIDRIAAPVLGRSGQLVSLLRPRVAQAAHRSEAFETFLTRSPRRFTGGGLF